MRTSTPKLDNLITVRRAIQRLAGGLLDEGGMPEFGSIKLTNLTASRLVYTNTSKVLASVTNLASWIGGTTNRVTVSDDGDGTITLTGPQDIHTGASPTFTDLTLSSPSNIYSLDHDSFANVHQDVNTNASPTFAGLTSTGTINATTGEILVEDNATLEPEDKSDGYVGVAMIGTQPRIYFAVEGKVYYVEGTAAAGPLAGSPIGLLLTLTYA